MNKKAYILGAGSSRELKFNINHIDVGYRTFNQKYIECPGPLSRGFFYDSFQLSSKLDSYLNTISPLKLYQPLSRYITEYCQKKYSLSITKDDLLSNKEKSGKVNVEDLFINVEDDLKRISSSHPLRNNDPQGIEVLSEIVAVQMELRNFIFDALSMISNYCYSKNHHIFERYLVKSDVPVISFNWDILFDEAMSETGMWNYRTGYGKEPELVAETTWIH